VFFLEKGGNKKPLTSYKFFFVLSSATHLVAEIGVLLGATQIILRAIVHLKLDTRSSGNAHDLCRVAISATFVFFFNDFLDSIAGTKLELIIMFLLLE